jgi:hypothetical protein
MYLASLTNALLHAAPNAELAGRARNFLLRQNALFEMILGKLRKVTPGGDETELASLMRNHPAFTEQRARLDRELQKLDAEWRRSSGTLPAEVRAEIAALAKRGEALAEEVRAEYERVIGGLKDQSEDVKKSLGALARGRNLVRRYAPGLSNDTTFIDGKG